jgi:hypothetical protein
MPRAVAEGTVASKLNNTLRGILQLQVGKFDLPLFFKTKRNLSACPTKTYPDREGVIRIQSQN